MRRAKRTYKKRSDLPPILANFIGEANKSFMRQEYERATELCKRVMSQVSIEGVACIPCL